MFKTLIKNSLRNIKQTFEKIPQNKRLYSSSQQTQQSSNGLNNSNYYISIIPPLQTLDHLESLQKHIQKSLSDTTIHWHHRYHMHIKVKDIPELKEDLNSSLLRIKAIMDNTVKEVDPFTIELENLQSIGSDNSLELLMMFRKGEDHINKLIERLNDAFIQEKINLNVEPNNELRHHIPIGKIVNLNVSKDELSSIEASFSAMRALTSFEAREILLIHKTSIDSNRSMLLPMHMSPLKVSDKGIKRRSRYFQSNY